MRDIKDMNEEEILQILHEDSEQIEPPESLSPASIERRLQGVKQIHRGRKSPWLIAAGMAACLVLGVFAGVITYSLIRGGDTASETVAETPVRDEGKGENEGADEIQTSEGAELDYEGVCDIINNYNKNSRNTYRYDDMNIVEEAIPEEEAPAAEEASSDMGDTIGASKSMGEAAGSSMGTDDYSRTDEQVAGVEEGDIVKTDGKHIYTVEATTFGVTIHIIEPNGAASSEAGSIEIQGTNCHEMYIHEDKLIIVGGAWGAYDMNQWIEDSEESVPSSSGAERNAPGTVITVVDIHDPANPKVDTVHFQTGQFQTSRISDGFLYTFTEDEYFRETDYDKSRYNEYIPQIDGESIAADHIVRAGMEDTNNYMVMTSLSLSAPDRFTDSMAALGGGANYYVSTEHIYIARQNQQSETYFFGMIDTGNRTTSLTKFSYLDGHFTKDVGTVFRGEINNSYYMHEYQGNFCFVYTSTNSDWEPVNGLCVLDENMKKLGELTGIAPGETIYASYYIENMAYFVTYRNTDPVFAVDISDPTKPVQKSELKLPGFSSYLHSFGEGELIGIGYGDSEKDGVSWDNTPKLSLFRIGEDYDITELSKVFSDQYERHIADVNHKAVFIDEQRGIVGLGLTNYSRNDENRRNSHHYVAYQQKGEKLVKVMDTNDEKEMEGLSVINTRGVRIGNIFYVCEPSGVSRAYVIGSDGEKWKPAK